MPPFLLALGLLSIPPYFPCCNACYPYSHVYRPHLVRCPAQFAVLCHSSCPVYIKKLHEDSKGRQTVRGIKRGAADTGASKGNKRYNTGNRAGYSATLDAAGTAALNPRASGTFLM